MKKKKRRTGALLAAVLCMQAALSYAGEPGPAPARENIRRYSEIFDAPEEIPAPEEQIRDESGTVYKLKEQDLVSVPVTGRREKISGQTVYRGVSQSVAIPKTAVMKVLDEESGEEFEAELSLEKTEYSNERWEDGLYFSATFHVYGADYYTFNGLRILHREDKPALSGCEAELLAAIGEEQEECLIEDYSWSGDPYMNEEGVLCRDVLIEGRQKVWDCTCVYSGLTMLPDYDRYRMLLIYEELPEEPSESNISTNETGDSDARLSPQTVKEGFWDRLIKIVKRGLVVTVGIVFMIAAALILRFLLKKVGDDEF